MNSNPYSGKLIVFEGLDGSGQTTQAQLLTKWFVEKRNQLAYYTKEPTDGPLGALLKLSLSHRLVSAKSNRKHEALDPITMALLFASDRQDHLNNDVIPKLKGGIHVVADRYYLSSLAYQSIGGDYEWIKEINRHAIRPDLTLFLDVPPAVCVKRMQAQRWHVELYEDLTTLEAVQQNFVFAMRQLGREGERIETVNANQPAKDVHRIAVQLIKNYLKSVLDPTRFRPQEREKQLGLLMETAAFTEAEIAGHQEA
jgi:dTMP kinase